ncbi:MAG: hypothetical protein PUJ51_22195 [Clostridiales bacterium]|uniref:hypothetical protein n=1 Tax=Terrisporobacter sp. TaxID=1965305 RepID=UPI002A589623|nr:hypothetical protein [Terrisporobacter sp.]MDD7757167.1 hypothetical protein [Clostridiales bacterium]MDY4137683.1 hypothetical protein [Terrisporobacter sp.]
MRGESGLTASDVALLSGRNGNNDGFGDNGSWWVIIFLIFAFMGWGRGNNGFGGGSNGYGAMDNYVLASDFATIQRQLSDGFGDLTAQSRYIQNGLCDGFYAMNTSLLNGFAGVNNSIMTNGYETRNAINNLSSNLASCCCNLRSDIQGVNYNLATNTCALQNTMNMNTRDIVDTVNANYRAIHEELVANKLEMKNDRIAEQQNEINALRLKASQEAQNAYLLSELKPCPSPSYIVPNPNCCYNYQVTGGCGNF